MESERDNEGEYRSQARKFEGPGGTPGGLGTFLLGGALAIVGGYLIMTQVNVTSGYWQWWGRNTFGLTLSPLVIGIGVLFFNGRSVVGWALAGGGLLIIFAGVLSNLVIYFRQTSLFNVILMLVLFTGGLGLMARALKRHEP
jgi:hypothetical protein